MMHLMMIMIVMVMMLMMITMSVHQNLYSAIKREVDWPEVVKGHVKILPCALWLFVLALFVRIHDKGCHLHFNNTSALCHFDRRAEDTPWNFVGRCWTRLASWVALSKWNSNCTGRRNIHVFRIHFMLFTIRFILTYWRYKITLRIGSSTIFSPT